MKLAITCLFIGGVLTLMWSAGEALQQGDILREQDIETTGTIVKATEQDGIVVRYFTEDGRSIEAPVSGALYVPGYSVPYSGGEEVDIAYEVDDPISFIVTDSREWDRIAMLALFGITLIVWGWLIQRFGPLGIGLGLGFWFVSQGVASWTIIPL